MARNIRLALQTPWKRRLIIIEVVSLLVLIVSLWVFGQDKAAGASLDIRWLLVPVIASLTMFLSFLGLMYLRWQSSALTGSRQRVQKLLFTVMALTLLSIWALAVLQTWQSLGDATGSP